MDIDESGQGLAEQVWGFHEVYAAARSAQAQHWAARDYSNAHSWASGMESAYDAADEETKGSMETAMVHLCKEAGNESVRDEEQAREVLANATDALALSLLQNTFLSKEILSLALAHVELKSAGAEVRGRTERDILERANEVIAMRMCLQSVDNICGGVGQRGSESERQCEERACARLLRKRWATAMTQGEEQLRTVTSTLEAYFSLYPKEYSCLLIAMLSPSAAEPALSSVRGAGRFQTAREKEKYADGVPGVNSCIARFLQPLRDKEGVSPWEHARPDVLLAACENDSDLSGVVMRSFADVLAADDTPATRQANVLLSLRTIAAGPPSRTRAFSRQLLAIAGY